MNRLDHYADWLVQNADKKGTPEFETVASAYRELRGGAQLPAVADTPKPDPTVLGQVREFGKGIVPGAIGLVESAAVGASALLPESMEAGARERIESVASAAKRPFAAREGYEDTVGRKFGQALGSTLPFLVAGPLGLAGRAAAVGLGVGAGAGEARTRAEEFGATGEQRSTATALGTIPGALEVFAPFRILSRVPDAAKASGVQLVKRAAMAGGEEAAQEAASGWAQNLIAQGVYNPEQELIEGLGEEAAYGGAVGALVQGVMDLALGRRARGDAQAAERELSRTPPMRPETDLFGQPVGAPIAARPELGDLYADRMALDQAMQMAPAEQRPVFQSQIDELDARIREIGAQPDEAQMGLGLDNAREYEDLVLERARLQQLPETPETAQRIAALESRSNEILTQGVVDRRKAAQSAFSQPDQQMEMREALVEGDTQQVPPAQAQAPTAPEPTLRQAIDAGMPTMQMPLMFDQTQQEMTVPDGAITLEDLQGIGVPMRTSRAWFESNVVGRTPEQVQALVDADPTLTEGKGARARVLREILAPKVPEFQESTDASTDIRPESAVDGQPTEPSVGVPDAGVGAEPGPIDAAAARVAPSDGAGVVPSEPDVSAEPVSEVTPTPTLTPQEQAFDDLARAVQDTSSPNHVEALSILGRSEGNPAFMREYDSAVRRVLGYPTTQPAPAPLPEAQRGMPARRAPTTPVDPERFEPVGATPDGGTARGVQQMIEPVSDADARKMLAARQARSLRESREQRGTAPETAPDTQESLDLDAGRTPADLRAERNRLTNTVLPQGRKQLRELERQRRTASPEARAGIDQQMQSLQGEQAAATQRIEDIKRRLAGGAPQAQRNRMLGNSSDALTAAVQSGDARAALQVIADGKGFNPLEVAVAKRLLRAPSLPAMEVVPTLDAPGQYDPVTDTVQLREVDSHTVLHEFVHANTHRLITAVEDGQLQNAGVTRLNNLFSYVQRTQPRLFDEYGMRSLTEFAAESMSNPDFQSALTRIPYQRGNAFTEFARSILRMLGITGTTDNTALAEALVAVESILPDGRRVQEMATGRPGTIARVQRGDASTAMQAMDIVRALNMDTKPEPTATQRLRDSWDTARENPRQVTQNASQALTRWKDRFETAVWSSDAGIQNAIQRSLIENSDMSPQVMGTLLDISTSQAAGSEAFAGQFLSDGAATYDTTLHKWVTQDSADSMVAISRSLDVIVDKYGLTKEQAEQVVHTAFVARRLDGLSKANDRLYARADALRQQKRDREADALEAQTKFVHLDADQIAEGLQLINLMPELQQTIDHWNGFRSNVLDVMVESGLLSRGDADAWLDAMDYVPFYRDEQLENSAGPREYMRTLQVQGEKRLKGSAQPVHDVFDNMARWAQFAVSRSVKNRTGLALAETAVEHGFMEPFDSKNATAAERRAANVVRVWKNGEQVEFNALDPLYMDAFQGLQSVSIPAMKVFADLANVLRQSVVLNPLFSLAQVPQDAFAAMFTSGLSPRYALTIPARAVKEFVKTVMGTSRTHNELRRIGAVGQRDVTAAIVRMDAEVLAGLKAPAGFKAKLMSRLHHIAMSSDNAVRQAVYEAAQEQGLSKAEAIEKAYQIINFRNRGTSKLLSVAAQVIPFFNAYLAATHVMYKTVTGAGTSPQTRADGMKRLAAMSASVATLSFMYAMLMGDDEAYEDTRPQLRDRLLMIPGTGVGIPLRPDVFLLPKVLAENLYHSITDSGLTDGARFRKSVQEVLANSLLSPTTVPQAIKPIVEVGINHSFFTGRPLIGVYEQQMEKSRQFNEYTSELGKVIGSAGVVSPIAVDHVIRGMLGSLGGAILYTTNHMLHSDPEVERPSMEMRDIIGTVPGMAAFVTKSTENALRGDFFELREATRRADMTLKDLEKRSPHLIEAFLEDKTNMARVVLAQDVESIARELSSIRKDIRDVSNAPVTLMSANQKQKYLKELRDLEKQLLKALPLRELRKEAKI
jgi:hypothetical protein